MASRPARVAAFRGGATFEHDQVLEVIAGLSLARKDVRFW